MVVGGREVAMVVTGGKEVGTVVTGGKEVGTVVTGGKEAQFFVHLPHPNKSTLSRATWSANMFTDSVMLTEVGTSA